jgi:predicted Zn-dependent protease
MQSTGNGGGSHNLVLAPGTDDLPALLRRMGRGLLVTEQLEALIPNQREAGADALAH